MWRPGKGQTGAGESATTRSMFLPATPASAAINPPPPLPGPSEAGGFDTYSNPVFGCAAGSPAQQAAAAAGGGAPEGADTVVVVPVFGCAAGSPPQAAAGGPIAEGVETGQQAAAGGGAVAEGVDMVAAVAHEASVTPPTLLASGGLDLDATGGLDLDAGPASGSTSALPSAPGPPLMDSEPLREATNAGTESPHGADEQCSGNGMCTDRWGGWWWGGQMHHVRPMSNAAGMACVPTDGWVGCGGGAESPHGTHEKCNENGMELTGVWVVCVWGRVESWDRRETWWE